MIDMKIGPAERTWTAADDIEEDWGKTCFRIKTDSVNLVLGTPVEQAM